MAEARQDGSSISQPEAQLKASGDAAVEAGREPGGELEALRQALATAEEGVRTQRDLYLRAAAELDNVRKRAQRDIENAHRYAIEGLAAELLAVRDGLELGVRNGATADVKTLVAGQEATLKLLDRTFEKFAVKQLDPAGERFDPKLHEAVMMQQSDAAAPNTVLQVVQPGYELKGRLLRPARVVVAKAAEGS